MGTEQRLRLLAEQQALETGRPSRIGKLWSLFLKLQAPTLLESPAGTLISSTQTFHTQRLTTTAFSGLRHPYTPKPQTLKP